MIHDSKPPLDEALLIHFGVKGCFSTETVCFQENR